MRKCLVLLTLSAVFFVVYCITAIHSAAFHGKFIQGEDHLVEWLTFAGFLLASVLTLSLHRFRANMKTPERAFYFLLGLFFLVCAGEEISWGQRVVGFDTPDSVKLVNEQDEFNLHNLDFEHLHPKDLISWFMKLYGIILPAVLLAVPTKRWPKMRLYVSASSLILLYLFPELINVFDDRVELLLEDHFPAPPPLPFSLQIEELVEMYWGICVAASSWVTVSRWKIETLEQQTH